MPDAAAGKAWGITGLIAADKIAETQTPRDGDNAPSRDRDDAPARDGDNAPPRDADDAPVRDGDNAPPAPCLGTDTEQPRKPTVGRVTDGPCWLIV